jgi:hypothetical protein
MIRIALLAGLGIALAQAGKAPAAASKPDLNAPAPLDPQPDKSTFKLVGDGKGHYLAFHFEDPQTRAPSATAGGIPRAVFWSDDGKAFFAMRTFGGGAEGDKSFDVVFWEPRLSRSPNFGFREGKYTVACTERPVELRLLTPEQARPVLDGATFHKPRWTRKPYALARDDKGTYYFVDHLRDEENRYDRRSDFRLFTGPRGAMKEQKMTNLVSDTEGDIFGTKSGDFRLVLNKKDNVKESKWVQGGKETRLTSVPVEDNAQVIYNDLGVYQRAKLGTPCDEY